MNSPRRWPGGEGEGQIDDLLLSFDLKTMAGRCGSEGCSYSRRRALEWPRGKERSHQNDSLDS